MKKVISILILLILLFIVGQWTFTYFKSGHEVSYQISYNDKTFSIYEKYLKNLDNSYDIVITHGNESYYYNILNKFNKQQKIIKRFEYYEKDGITCIYPILLDESGSYLQCLKDNNRYSSYGLNNDFMNEIRTDLKNKGYININESDTSKTKQLANSTIYSNNLQENDFITLWNYKGIQIIASSNSTIKNVLSYDKYENSHGYLVDKYYIIPEYSSSKVREFNKVTVIDIVKDEIESIDLEYTLSSNTYINGVIDNKLYYTDPVNLLQIEINPANGNSRLIGSKELGGQVYDNKWQNTNIYDLANKKKLFTDIPKELSEKYNYEQIQLTGIGYYFYNSNGEVYQVLKEHLDNPILLFKVDNLNNFKVIKDTIYYVMGDTLYYFNENIGSYPVLRNSELRFNNFNRIDIYRRT